MRSYRLIQGARHQILSELEEHVIGAEHLGAKSVEAHRAALAAIRAGADEATTSRAVYRVAAEVHPVPLSIADYREGTREELVAELKRLRDDVAPGRTDKAAAYQEAIDDLLGGKACAGVRRTVYLVAEAQE